MKSVDIYYYNLKSNWIKVIENLKTNLKESSSNEVCRVSTQLFVFLLTVPLWGPVLICADSSRWNLDIALRQLIACPDGRTTLVLKFADLSKNMGRIVDKNEAK